MTMTFRETILEIYFVENMQLYSKRDCLGERLGNAGNLSKG